MCSNNIAIICDGKEISYGMNLLHLFQYKNEEIRISSSKFTKVSVEIYSSMVFQRANISKSTVKIYIGLAKKIDHSYQKVFDKFGMEIYQNKDSYILKANDAHLNSYDDFVLYANKKRKEYIESEIDYFKKANEIAQNWIVDEFVVVNKPKGIFRNADTKIKQLYDCLAFIIYLDIVEM